MKVNGMKLVITWANSYDDNRDAKHAFFIMGYNYTSAN